MNRDIYPGALGGPLTGDVTSTAGVPSVRVTGIQGVPVDPALASEMAGTEQGLFYNGTNLTAGWPDANMNPVAASGDNGVMYTNAPGAITEDGNLTTDGDGNLTGNSVTAATVVVSNAITAKAASVNHYEGGNAGSYPVPTITAGAGAGTGATCSLDAHASDSFFTCTVTTGTTPAVNSVIATVTFGTAYGSVPHCVFSPSDAAGNATGVSLTVCQNKTANHWALSSLATALTGSTTYSWDVVVGQ